MRVTTTSIALLVLLTACKQSDTAAPPPQNATPAAGHSGAHPEGTPSARTTLLPNLGTYHRMITTSSAEAQTFFDEGLTLLYGFNHEESFRSFARAAVLDPHAPMPHWGMSLALGTNYNDTATPDRLQQAHLHLTRAQERAASGSIVERALVDALAKRYVAQPNDGQQPAREEAYAAAMREVSSRFADDVDAATLAAESMMNLRPWKLYAIDGVPAPGTEEIVAKLESVLKRNPEHPGANHYYIHAVEASRSPERALTSAKRLESLVPGAGHLVHMPAHIYHRTGDYRLAAKSNAVAAAVDEKYVKDTGATGMYPTMYYGHNLQFLSAAAMMAGNFTEARDAGRKTAALVEPLAGDVVMLQPFAMQEVLVLVRFERWDDVLAMPRPAFDSAQAKPDRPVQLALYHYAQGAAHAGKGDVKAAEIDAKNLAAVGSLPNEMISLVNSVDAVLTVAREDLAGRIAAAKGDSRRAIEAFTRAVAAEDQLAYNEPPDWLLPEREQLGSALLRADRVVDAERVFRADLERNRQNPRSLYGVHRALEKQGKAAQASEARKAFDTAWQGADTELKMDPL